MNKFNIGDEVYNIECDVLSSFIVDVIELDHSSGKVLYGGEDRPGYRVAEEHLYITKCAALDEMIRRKQQQRDKLARELAALDRTIKALRKQVLRDLEEVPPRPLDIEGMPDTSTI